jgi:hypothetical protein
MKNYLNEYNNLYMEIIKEFNHIENISFNYEDDNIYDLPRTFSIDKYNSYTEYAIIEIKKDVLIGISLEDDRDEKVFYFDDLNLPALIELLEFTKQLN